MYRNSYSGDSSDDEIGVGIRHARPWDYDDATRHRVDPDGPGFQSLGDNQFRQQVRGNVGAKWTQPNHEKYKGDDVGHIFAEEHGGARTINNVFMQEKGWNRGAKDDFDEIHAAFNGYKQTEKSL